MLTRRELREQERAAQVAEEIPEAERTPEIDDSLAAAIAEAEARVAEGRARESAVAAAVRRSGRRGSGQRSSGQRGSGQRAARSAGTVRSRRLGGIMAMSFVAAIAVATSMPALSLLSPEEVQAQQLAAVATAGFQDGGETQSFVAGDSTDETVTRDNYGVTEKKTQTNVAAIVRTSSSEFTNNPNGTIQWPFAVGVPVSDHFGPRSCAGCSANHGGTDFNPGNGSPIQVIADGVVRYVEDGEGSLGVHVIIDHQIDGELVSSVYAHMQHGSVAVKEGDPVKVGQLVGLVGTTGMSTGPHLHFEIREDGTTKVDSFVWLQNHAN
ncbi:M23 family metallopeptidase [Microbacteriaceae bacterium VKM Ac-2854]|nr:M23 family metallopeptidase [Microbacteriaceae bacterium VKM Ac-2854]